MRITTKEPLQKQVIILMNKSNAEFTIKQANFYIVNINRQLKEANSKTFTNFICLENNGVIITTNQATSVQDMSIIYKYIRKTENINSEHINIF